MRRPSAENEGSRSSPIVWGRRLTSRPSIEAIEIPPRATTAKSRSSGEIVKSLKAVLRAARSPGNVVWTRRMSSRSGSVAPWRSR